MDIVVRRVGDNVVSPFLASARLAAKAFHAAGQLLAVVSPVGPAPPAAVDRVCGLARALVLFSSQIPPCAVTRRLIIFKVLLNDGPALSCMVD
ncbi:hypothetical protein ACFX2K_045493 [Malus domestica]